LPQFIPPLEPLEPLEPLLPLEPLDPLDPPLVRHMMSAVLSLSQPLATDALPELSHFHVVDDLAAHASAASYWLWQLAGTFDDCASQSETQLD